METQEDGPESNDVIVSRLAQRDEVPWYSKPNLRLLYLLLAPTCLAVEITSGFDASMVNGLQAVPSWLEYFNHPHAASLGLMASMLPFGSVAAVPFAPLVVDKIGRRNAILFGALIAIVAGIIQGSALNFTMFVTGRFLLGFGDVFRVIAATSLVAELAHPKERGVFCSLFTTFYNLGAVTAAALTLGTFAMASNWGWRIPSYFQVVPSLIQVAFISSIPESPRWLVSRGRGNEAYSILVQYHAEGDENSEFARAEYTQIKETLEAELKVTQMSGRSTLSTSGMRQRVIIATALGLFAACSGIGLISSYLPLILDGIGIHDNRTKNIVNLARTSWNLVNSICIALIAPRYPRRWIFLISTVSVFVVFTAWTAASANYSLTHDMICAQLALFLIFLYSPGYNLGFNVPVFAYLVELFPFRVRALGIALFQWGFRGGTFLVQFVDPIGIDLAGWKWYIIYCVWNAFQIVFVYFMFPETAGRTLEELTFLYEDEREVLRHGGAETLREDRVTETYGTMEDGRTRVVHGELTE